MPLGGHRGQGSITGAEGEGRGQGQKGRGGGLKRQRGGGWGGWGPRGSRLEGRPAQHRPMCAWAGAAGAASTCTGVNTYERGITTKGARTVSMTKVYE